MNPNYRQISRDCIERAKQELSSGDDYRVRYAALEIRQAIEAITYDRVDAYKAELDPDVYARWEPRHLLAEIYRVDPEANVKTSISVGLSSDSAHSLGSEIPFTLQNAKRFYDSLSSYLHIPTYKQLHERGGQNLDRLRKRCVEAIKVFDEVLASTIWNVTIGKFASIDCMRLTCGHRVARRVVKGQEILDAKCHHCRAVYHLQVDSDGNTKWTGDRSSVICPCGEKTYFWNSDLRPGLSWDCVGCGSVGGTVHLLARVDRMVGASSKP